MNHDASAELWAVNKMTNPDILQSRLKRAIEEGTAALAAVAKQDAEAFRRHSEVMLSLAYFIAPNAPFQNDQAIALLRQIASSTDAEWGCKLAQDFFAMGNRRG